MSATSHQPSGTALPPRVSSRRTGSGVGVGTARARSGGDGQSGYNPVGQNNTIRGVTSPFGTAPYHPAGDAQTYRDLLIFEERLKQNAARLMKRRTKYQTFLVLLCAAIGLCAYYVFVRPAQWQPLHYLNVTVLLITATMLLLFFASGMYGERITAANKFVPQANRSLRSYNMYLNTKTVPRRSLLRFFKSSEAQIRSTPSQTAATSDADVNNGKRPTSSSSLEKGTLPSRVIAPGGTIAAARRQHIASIPPSNNARGELIFGSKVSPTFREGYERYRAAFERRRREKLNERQRRGWRRWWSSMFSREASAAGTSASKTAAHARRIDGSATEKAESQNGTESRSLHSPNLRGNAGSRSSPRTTRTQPKVGAIVSAPASGSENSSPASSRASSPNSSPWLSDVAVLPAGREERRGRVASTRSSATLAGHEVLADLSNGRADILEDGELLPKAQARRGRDRTPSLTANSDERLLHSRSSSSRRSSELGGGVGGADNVASITPPLDSQKLQGTIVEEIAHEEPASSGEQHMPDPAKVANKRDSRSEVEATLREPIQDE